MHREAYQAMLQAERDAQLDDILSRWHHWAIAYQAPHGYPPTAAGFDQYRVSRQYDDENGALDKEIELKVMRTVNFQITEMAEPFRSAIYCNARNLYSGVSVWRSPRLPADDIERARVVVTAREMLSKRLTMAGVF
jgi:hypothetical protein